MSIGRNVLKSKPKISELEERIRRINLSLYYTPKGSTLAELKKKRKDELERQLLQLRLEKGTIHPSKEQKEFLNWLEGVVEEGKVPKHKAVYIAKDEDLWLEYDKYWMRVNQSGNLDTKKYDKPNEVTVLLD